MLRFTRKAETTVGHDHDQLSELIDPACQHYWHSHSRHASTECAVQPIEDHKLLPL